MIEFGLIISNKEPVFVDVCNRWYAPCSLVEKRNCMESSKTNKEQDSSRIKIVVFFSLQCSVKNFKIKESSEKGRLESTFHVTEKEEFRVR